MTNGNAKMQNGTEEVMPPIVASVLSDQNGLAKKTISKERNGSKQPPDAPGKSEETQCGAPTFS